MGGCLRNVIRFSKLELRTQNNLFRSVRPGDSTLRLVRVAIMRVTLCIHIYSTNAVYLRNTRGGRHIIIIIIRQPLCPVVGRRPQHAVSKLPCLVLSSAISCRSSICPGRLSIAWLVSLVVFSCHMVSNW